MRPFFRLLMVAALGLLFGLPVLGDETTGGGGDSGVWILPRAGTQMTLQLNGGGTVAVPRDTRVVQPATGLVMQMSPEMTTPLAVIREMPSNVQLTACVSGTRVSLPPRTLQAIASTLSSGYAEGLMVDGSGRGYRIVLMRQSNGSVLAQIY